VPSGLEMEIKSHELSAQKKRKLSFLGKVACPVNACLSKDDHYVLAIKRLLSPFEVLRGES
jgi:hypothetical protein